VIASQFTQSHDAPARLNETVVPEDGNFAPARLAQSSTGL
jgi:hypothetical protein